jgi:hypothetical protein
VASCPAGHESASDDFCDVCGVLIGAAPSFAPAEAPAAGATSGTATSTSTGGTSAGRPAAPDEACPRCGAARAGQYCESCGYDFTTSPAAAPIPAPAPDPAAPATVWPPVTGTGQEWAAVVTADRAYFDSVQAADGPDAAAIEFPVYCPQRRFPLATAEVRIGRRSASSGISPEIDLSVPPADPGVSRLHAVLLRTPDGGWTIVDPGSANGTEVNGTEIPRGQAVPLGDGDRVHLGAWTELRLVRERPGD